MSQSYTVVCVYFQICTVVSVIVVSYRQDVIGCFYILVLGILLLLNMYRRRYVRRVWFIYLIVLALLLPAQYFSALGLPTTLCHGKFFFLAASILSLAFNMLLLIIISS